MKKLSLLLAIVFSLFSCDKDLTFTKYETVLVSLTKGECDNQDAACGKIYIEYPKFKGNDKDIDTKLNNLVDSYISALGNGDNAKSIADDFINGYTQFITDFPEATANQQNIKSIIKIVNNTNHLLSMVMNSSGYTGGAHGFNFTKYINTDPNTGKQLMLKDIVNDKVKLTSIAKSIFFEKYNINNDEYSLSSQFSFNNNTFELNENFIITDSTINFHYNQYEIASYAQGEFNISIPKNKIDSLINTNYIVK